MPFCASCGNEVKDGAKFCGSCGAAAGRAPAPAPASANISQRRTAGRKANVVGIVVGIAAGFVALIIIIWAATVMPQFMEAEKKAKTEKPSTNTVTDTRDGTTYRTIKIGSQTWMAENLNYKTGSSKCYGEGGQVYDTENGVPIKKTLSTKEVQDNCVKYGRLYNWTTAETACPSGWHLPTDAEWDVWMVKSGSIQVKDENGDIIWETAGKKLKSKAGWEDGGNGTDDYGFSALSGGRGSSDGGFNFAGYRGGWWSATKGGANSAWARYMRYDSESVDRGNHDKAFLLSVRCVQD